MPGAISTPTVLREERPAMLRVQYECDLAGVREAAGRVRRFLRQFGLSAEELENWELICVEAGNNAAQHVRPGAKNVPLRFEVAVSATEVEVRIIDHSIGFELPQNPQLPDIEAEAGRGLYLIFSLSDRREYLHGVNENAFIVARKRATAGSVEPASVVTVEKLEAELEAMTEELAASYENLAAIFRFTTELSQSDIGTELDAKWMDELTRIIGAEWYVLRLRDRGTNELTVKACSNPALRLPPLPAPRPGEIVVTAEAKAISQHQDVWFDAAYELANVDPLRGFGARTRGHVHPIFAAGSLVGVLSVGNRNDAGPFTSRDVNIIQTFADFLGLQIRNRDFRQEDVRNKVFKRELEIAAAIQQSLLPQQIAQPPGLYIGGEAINAQQVGGDFYDVLTVSANSVTMVIADVMGKGVAAAMFGAILRSQIRSRPDLADRPGLLLTWLNRTLFAELDRVEMFITTQVVHLDVARRAVHVSSAGHCPLLVASPAGEILEFQADGPPLGITEHQRYLEQTFTLRAGGRALMFTDGVIDVRNPMKGTLGLPRLKEWFGLCALAGIGGPELRRSLLNLLKEFREGHAAGDDITFLFFADLNIPHPRPPHAPQNPDRR